MSKWVNVKCIAIKEVMVEIEDDKEHKAAVDIAANMLGCEYEKFESTDVPRLSVDKYKCHADAVFEI